MSSRFDKWQPPEQDRSELKKDDVLLAQFLEGLSVLKSNDNEMRQGKKTSKLNRYGSQPSLNGSQWQQHKQTKCRSKEVGPYAWVPMATKTAVGYGSQPLVSKRKQRPISAPIQRARSNSYGSLDSSMSGDTWAGTLFLPLSHRSRRNKSYMSRPSIICVRAFQNGGRDNYARVTAVGMSQLLEECTTKLGLTSAARKIFLPDGTIVISPRQMAKDSDVYVSCGEPFKDPFKEMREREKIRLGSFWTMNGILLPMQSRKTRKLKASVGKQMKELVENQRRRILVFKNGTCTEGVEVVANRFDEFLDDCTSKLGLESGAKFLFDAKGQVIESFAQVPVLDGLLSAVRGQILGPLWVSKGEGFSPKGVHAFLTSKLQQLTTKIQITKNYQKELEHLLNGEDVNSIEVQTMKTDEAAKEKKITEALLKTLNESHSNLSKQLNDIIQKCEEEEATGRSYKFQHISEIDPNSRLVGFNGLRLSVNLNGAENFGPCKVPLSVKEIMKAGKTKEKQIAQLLLMLNMNNGLKQHFLLPDSQKRFTRLFLSDGIEVKDVTKLEYDSDVWLSYGEDHIPSQYDIFGIDFYSVHCVDLVGKKTITTKETLFSNDDNGMLPDQWVVVSQMPQDTIVKTCKPQENDILGFSQGQVAEPQETGEYTDPSITEDANVTGKNAQHESLLNLINSHFSNRIHDDGPFLLKRDSDDTVTFPELSMKTAALGNEMYSEWATMNSWLITSDGFIANKPFPRLVLCIKDTKIKIEDEENIVHGFSVSFGERNEESPYQRWTLTADGFISSTANPDLHLTNVSSVKFEVYPDDIENQGDAQISATPTAVSQQLTKPQEISIPQETVFSSSSSSGNESISDGSREESDLSDSFLDSLSLKGLKERAMLHRKSKRKKRKERTARVKTQLEQPSKITDGNASPKQSEEFGFIEKLPQEYKGENISICVIPKAPSKHPIRACQRWAVKIPMQGSGFTVSNDALSAKWKHQHLTWPVNEANQWIADAVDGYLLPNAPRLKRIQTPKQAKAIDLPVRLRVLKNGDALEEHAVTVIGPDVSNMTRNVSVNLKIGKKSQKDFNEGPSSSVSDVEFHQFLDRCTDQLRLPFAARRLFTKEGKEIFSINKLERDEIVYVSTGEAWSNPDQTIAEQQRRSILANLASDVSKMKQFLSLRNQTDFIIQVNGSIKVGASVSVGPRPPDPEPDVLPGEDEYNNGYSEERFIENMQSMLTAHQRAHIRSEERLGKLKKSFQVYMMDNDAEEFEEFNGEEDEFSNPSLARKFALVSNQDTRLGADAYHKWIYKNGFIHLQYNSKFVLGIQEDTAVKSNHRVVLCTKKLEDPNQRWRMEEDGTVHLRSNSDKVLTVSTPMLKKGDKQTEYEDQEETGYYGQHLIIMPKMPPVYGNAHQIFLFDPSTGYIEAFATDLINKEITAANKGGICTYTVLGAREISQLGYEMEGLRKGKKKEKLYLCDACGKMTRGRKKLQKISSVVEFSCAMGNPKANGLKSLGSFTCLDSKVDLSYHEAESTLALWEMQLVRLKEESSIKILNQELRSCQITPSVRIRAFRNGDSSGRQGCLIIGTTINQLLDQCTIRLSLHQAARRMFTVDGEMITDMRQLLQPYYPELYFKGQSEQNITTGTKNKGKKKSNQQTSSGSLNGDTEMDPSAHVLYTRSDSVENENVLEDPNCQPERAWIKEDDEKKDDIREKHVSFADLDETTVEFETKQLYEKMDIRIPVDVWISTGEPFIPLQASDKVRLASLRQREEKALAMDYLEIEKHRLRQLQGRRYAGMTPHFERGVKPVLHKTWTEPTEEEEKVEQSIQDLKTHIKEVNFKHGKNGSQLLTKTKPVTNEDLRVYEIPRAIRIHVFPNGEAMDRARVVFATNILELLDRATSRLDLTSAARRIFTSEGEEINDFSSIKKNQFLCVTCGEKFVPHRDRKHKIEVRASWSRMRRGDGQIDSGNGTPVCIPRPPLALPSPASATTISKEKNNSNNKTRPKTAKN